MATDCFVKTLSLGLKQLLVVWQTMEFVNYC